MIKIYTNWESRPVFNGRVMDDTVITEKSGYRSARQQITELINGGIRLDASRKAAYDFIGNLPDDIRADPTRDLNLDLVDGDTLYQYYTDVLKRKDAAKAAKLAAQTAKETNDVKIDPVKAD